jgi:hypothetical protein
VAVLLNLTAIKIIKFVVIELGEKTTNYLLEFRLSGTANNHE